MGTDEAVFNMVLCTRSIPQLRATFEAYRATTGKGIIDTIKREMSGPLQSGFLAIGLMHQFLHQLVLCVCKLYLVSYHILLIF